MIVKNISNEIVDLKKNDGEGPSTRICFKKNFPLVNKTSPPTEGINMEDFLNLFKALASRGELSSDGQDEDEEKDGEEKED
jgi:hypothetical protein